MNDERIIEMYWDRNEQAISETKLKYGKYCYSVAFRILQNHGDAEECENETYLGAWNSIPPNRPDLFSAFLAKITRNISIMKLRVKNADKRGGGEAELSLQELDQCIPDSKSFNDEIDVRELAEMLNKFLWSLGEDERRVFVCRYWGCDSIAQIARQFGFGQSKVKMMLLRTRNKLRDFLEKEGVFS